MGSDLVVGLVDDWIALMGLWTLHFEGTFGRIESELVPAYRQVVAAKDVGSNVGYLSSSVEARRRYAREKQVVTSILISAR